MSTAILTKIAQWVAEATWQQIKKHAFKPDPNPIDAVLGGIARLEALVQKIDYQQQIRGPMERIYYWTRRMREVIDQINRTGGSPESIDEYNRLLSALRSEGSGIRFQSFRLHLVLMGRPGSPIQPDGFLKFWADQAYKKLSDPNNTAYLMHHYVEEIDNGIAAVAALLHHALALSLFIAIDNKAARYLRDECVHRIREFQSTVFNKYYPPALRQFKPRGYADPGSLLAQHRWFDMFKEDDGRRFMTIYDFWIRQLAMSGGGPAGYSPRSFAFLPERGNMPLGALQMHAAWPPPNDTNTRVKFYDGRPAGSSRVYAYTNSRKSGNTYDILFKLIPLPIPAGARNRTPVMLVPFLQSSRRRTPADQNNTFGHTWRMTVTTNPRNMTSRSAGMEAFTFAAAEDEEGQEQDLEEAEVPLRTEESENQGEEVLEFDLVEPEGGIANLSEETAEEPDFEKLKEKEPSEGERANSDQWLISQWQETLLKETTEMLGDVKLGKGLPDREESIIVTAKEVGAHK